MSDYLSFCCVELVKAKRIPHAVHQPSLWKFRVYISIIFSTWRTFLSYVQILNWLPPAFWSLCNIHINQMPIFSQDCSACLLQLCCTAKCSKSKYCTGWKKKKQFFLFLKKHVFLRGSWAWRLGDIFNIRMSTELEKISWKEKIHRLLFSH